MANTAATKRVKKKDEPTDVRAATKEARQLNKVKTQKALEDLGSEGLYRLEARSKTSYKGADLTKDTAGTSMSKGARQAAAKAYSEAKKEFANKNPLSTDKNFAAKQDAYAEKKSAAAAREYAAEERRETRDFNKGGAVKGFKPCSACPSPAKCKAAGKCLAKKMSKGGAPKGPTIMIAIAVPKKAPAKKGKK